MIPGEVNANEGEEERDPRDSKSSRRDWYIFFFLKQKHNFSYRLSFSRFGGSKLHQSTETQVTPNTSESLVYPSYNVFGG